MSRSLDKAFPPTVKYKTQVQKILYIFTRVSQDLGIFCKPGPHFGSEAHSLPQAELTQQLLRESFARFFSTTFDSIGHKLRLHLGCKTSAQASGKETLLPPMYNTCNIWSPILEWMVMNSTMGKVMMVKAMTGRAMPRIRLLRAIVVQTVDAIPLPGKIMWRTKHLRVSSSPPSPVTR